MDVAVDGGGIAVGPMISLTANGIRSSAPDVPCDPVAGRDPKSWMPKRPTNDPELPSETSKRIQSITGYITSLVKALGNPSCTKFDNGYADVVTRSWSKLLGRDTFSGLCLEASLRRFGGGDVVLNMRTARGVATVVGPTLRFSGYVDWGGSRRAIWDYVATEVLPRVPADCLRAPVTSASRAAASAKLAARRATGKRDAIVGPDIQGFTRPTTLGEVVDVSTNHDNSYIKDGVLMLCMSNAARRMATVANAINGGGDKALCRVSWPKSGISVSFKFIAGTYKGITVRVPETRDRLSGAQVIEAATAAVALPPGTKCKPVDIGDEEVDGQTRMYLTRK